MQGKSHPNINRKRGLAETDRDVMGTKSGSVLESALGVEILNQLSDEIKNELIEIGVGKNCGKDLKPYNKNAVEKEVRNRTGLHSFLDNAQNPLDVRIKIFSTVLAPLGFQNPNQNHVPIPIQAQPARTTTLSPALKKQRIEMEPRTSAQELSAHQSVTQAIKTQSINPSNCNLTVEERENVVSGDGSNTETDVLPFSQRVPNKNQLDRLVGEILSATEPGQVIRRVTDFYKNFDVDAEIRELIDKLIRSKAKKAARQKQTGPAALQGTSNARTSGFSVQLAAAIGINPSGSEFNTDAIHRELQRCPQINEPNMQLDFGTVLQEKSESLHNCREIPLESISTTTDPRTPNKPSIDDWNLKLVDFRLEVIDMDSAKPQEVSTGKGFSVLQTDEQIQSSSSIKTREAERLAFREAGWKTRWDQTSRSARDNSGHLLTSNSNAQEMVNCETTTSAKNPSKNGVQQKVVSKDNQQKTNQKCDSTATKSKPTHNNHCSISPRAFNSPPTSFCTTAPSLEFRSPTNANVGIFLPTSVPSPALFSRQPVLASAAKAPPTSTQPVLPELYGHHTIAGSKFHSNPRGFCGNHPSPHCTPLASVKPFLNLNLPIVPPKQSPLRPKTPDPILSPSAGPSNSSAHFQNHRLSPPNLLSPPRPKSPSQPPSSFSLPSFDRLNTLTVVRTRPYAGYSENSVPYQRLRTIFGLSSRVKTQLWIKVEQRPEPKIFYYDPNTLAATEEKPSNAQIIEQESAEHLMDYFAGFPFFGRPRLFIQRIPEISRADFDKFFATEAKRIMPNCEIKFCAKWPRIDRATICGFAIATFEAKNADTINFLIEYFASIGTFNLICDYRTQRKINIPITCSRMKTFSPYQDSPKTNSHHSIKDKIGEYERQSTTPSQFSSILKPSVFIAFRAKQLQNDTKFAEAKLLAQQANTLCYLLSVALKKIRSERTYNPALIETDDIVQKICENQAQEEAQSLLQVMHHIVALCKWAAMMEKSGRSIILDKVEEVIPSPLKSKAAMNNPSPSKSKAAMDQSVTITKHQHQSKHQHDVDVIVLDDDD